MIIGFLLIISLIAMAGTFYYTQVLSSDAEKINNNYDNINISVQTIANKVLEARRREKDFLLRFKMKYIKIHHQVIGTLGKELLHLDSLTTDPALSVLAKKVKRILENYSKEFKAMVKLKVRNGLDHKSGLLGALRNSVHKVEKVLGQYNEMELANSMLMMRRHEKDFIARGLDKYIGKMNLQYSRFIQLLDKSTLSATQQNIIRSLIKDYLDKFLNLAAGIKEIKEHIGKFRSAIHAIDPELKKLEQRTRLLVTQQKAQYKKNITNIKNIYYGMVILLLLLSLPLILLLSRSINHSTKRISQMLEEMASGEAMLTDRLALKGRDEMTEIAYWFNKLMDKLQQMLEEVSDLANNLTEAAMSSQHAKDQTTDAIYSQVEEIDKIASSIESMTISINQVAQDALHASEKANEADESATNGNQEVNAVIATIQQLAVNVEQAATSVRQIDEYSRSIDSVVAMINGIAEQTNLLALNAAIEAARAGEAGRGFAVVADEVRTLSKRTTASTEEIKSTISSLQKGTNKAVEIMNQSQEKAINSVTQAKQAGESINTITLSVASIAALNAQMNQSAAEQSKFAQQINNNIAEFNAATQKLADSAQKTMSDSGDLSQTAAMLQVMSKRFGYSNKNKPNAGDNATELEVELF